MAKTLTDVLQEHRYATTGLDASPVRQVECYCGWTGPFGEVAEHLSVVVRMWVMGLTGDKANVDAWRSASDGVRPFSSKWAHPADAAIVSFVMDTMGLSE